MANEEIRSIVRDRYAAAAKRVTNGTMGCCGASPSELASCDPITGDLYSAGQTLGLPAQAVEASLGCGNPTLLADLAPGETVLDLGSGGGIDVLLSARRVGPTGRAIGLDMTDEMLELARANVREAGATNVEFLKGHIEEIPLPDSSVDVILSNCVINLSADKDQVFSEAFRVLRPGGRLAISDVVSKGAIPSEIRRSLELWAGCVAGALDESDYRTRLERAGFEEVSIEATRVYDLADARTFLLGSGIDPALVTPELNGAFRSAFIRAKKRAA